MGGPDGELVLVGLAAFLVAVFLGGIIVLVVGHGRRPAHPPGPPPDPAAPLALGWRWTCAGCGRLMVAAPQPDWPVNYTYCSTCAERWRVRADRARQAVRERRNGHA